MSFGQKSAEASSRVGRTAEAHRSIVSECFREMLVSSDIDSSAGPRAKSASGLACRYVPAKSALALEELALTLLKKVRPTVVLVGARSGFNHLRLHAGGNLLERVRRAA